MLRGVYRGTKAKSPDEILQYTFIIEVDGCVEIPNHLLGEFAFCVKHNGKSYRTVVEL